ncbi:keratin-associated protein 19-2 [Amyelois transitella]|uniref:keratin-associated protein 19-2 n=1 Tax=Amyelois transitella TaxID=680683 RepID=UPI0029905766|nr:keratin-associated protein 19-2 [Amyelois transitella]
MDAKILFITLACLLALALAAPAENPDAAEKDLAVGDKEDLKTAASHWGGHYGGWGGWGYGGYGGYGGHYPYYGGWGGWGWPSYGYGYGYWPYGGYYGHGYGGWW